MLKVNGEYLDFNADIQIEKKIKLFEDISTIDGDLSFAFEIQLTSENQRILNIPVPDSISKTVYDYNNCVVQNSEGVTINIGSLRVERIIGYYASCSFLGGNSNWFALLDGDMTELSLSQYNRTQTEVEIVNSWIDTSGIIFPFMDLGTLITRAGAFAKEEDFVGCFFLHTLFKEVFNQSGIKIQGDLMDDPLYNQIVIATNTRSIIDKNANSIYAGSYASIPVPYPSNFEITLPEHATPFYTGDDVIFTGDLYFVAQSKMYVEFETMAFTDPGGGGSVTAPIFLNGAFISTPGRYTIINSIREGNNIVGFTRGTVGRILLDIGETLSISLLNQLGLPLNVSKASLKITPIIIYKAFGRSCVPLWTKQQFVSNVFKVFNVITSYNQFTKTLTINIFDKIKTKPGIEIGQYLNVEEIDYSSFISNYGQVNNFLYQEGSDEDLREYNIGSFIKYGSGVINANNDYIEKTANVIELDFTSPISYLSPAFNCSLEKINFVEAIETGDEATVISVTNSGGFPRFDITDADDFFESGNLVRITTGTYNGDYNVKNVTSTYIEVVGANYEGSAIGKAIKITVELTTDDSIYLFVHTGLRLTVDITDLDKVYLEENNYSVWSLAFFNLLRLGRNIEDDYKQGLSFGQTESELSFQRTLIDAFWQQFKRILNDPVKLLCVANLPWKVYNSIDFLQPVNIVTNESTNQYYVNRITGYTDSATQCEIELIKLS